uniref:Leucine-rich repeat-containing N-terminal plant-type domain-containing protein n=1 Tax=Manihot esculenta TaxID=3983 RepID=A0A2C9VYV6_MANES
MQQIDSLAEKINPKMRIVILYLALLDFLLFINCEGWCMEEEREALLQIKISINSPVGTAFSSWYGQDCCQWEGVECNVSTSRVIKIFFQHRRMVPYESWYPNATLFTQFKDLQELHLPGNQIGGFISFHALHKLKHLEKLDLRDNEIGNSAYLCWGNIHTLWYVDLSWNRLQGNIPQCLCESLSLTDLILSHNKLEGNLDECLSNLTSLKRLSLSESPSWSPSFSLNYLGLGGCNLNERSGRNIPSFLSTQHLEFLDLSYNSLFGRFPSWLLYNVSSELWIRGNNLSGPFPRSQRNMSLQLTTLDISDNNLYGLFPVDIKSYFPYLELLNVSHNVFNGSIQSIGGLSQLRYLDLSDNNLQGGTSHETFSNLTYLEYLNLSNNNLQGEVLPRNSSLPNLKWLLLDRNGFTGTFPDGLLKCSSLKVVSMSHNELSGDLSTSFPVFPQLKALLLRGNRFKGSIPLQLCQMKHLGILDLSENGLSGEIPTCFSNITSLVEGSSGSPDFEISHSSVSVDLTVNQRSLTFAGRILDYFTAIDLSSNKLKGTIPIQVGELKGIRFLNMSNNLLTGEIPDCLGNLKSVEGIDLSYNGLSGNIPSNLQDLTFLGVFDVGHNNLSGLIPLGSQFGTFDESSYLGNPNLCGPPLKKECNLHAEKSPGNGLCDTSSQIMESSILVFVVVIHILLLC